MNLKIDSRKIEPGDTFIALKAVNDGHNYIDDAIKRGATKIIAEKGHYEVETILVPDTKQYLIDYLKENVYEKIKDLTLIGITGTNGKTTTCYLLWQLLNKLEKKCAYIGTIGFYIEEKVKDLNNTTPEILDIYEMLLEAKEKGCTHVVMEVSSHALDMKRVEGLKYDITIFTNLTEDHLDYHKSMGNYALTKQKLFKMKKEKGIGIVNIDDKYAEYFIEQNTITYGFHPSTYQISNYHLEHKTDFELKRKEETIPFEINLLGKYNVYNMTAAIATLDTLDIDIKEIVPLVKELKAPTGRMDTISYGNNKIIIDYAHTPDAVENIITATKEFAKGKIIVIVGCGGNRDKAKRPIMAHIAVTLADFAIFTSDNPRDEDPQTIIDDMTNHLEYDNFITIVNREKAIEKGIQMLEKDDILLVLGKGHEAYQVIKKERLHFDDAEVVRNIIRR